MFDFCSVCGLSFSDALSYFSFLSPWPQFLRCGAVLSQRWIVCRAAVRWSTWTDGPARSSSAFQTPPSNCRPAPFPAPPCRRRPRRGRRRRRAPRRRAHLPLPRRRSRRRPGLTCRWPSSHRIRPPPLDVPPRRSTPPLRSQTTRTGNVGIYTADEKDAYPLYINYTWDIGGVPVAKSLDMVSCGNSAIFKIIYISLGLFLKLWIWWTWIISLLHVDRRNVLST